MTINQIKALRGMLACGMSKSFAIDAGIDACRSDTYRAALAKFHAERDACLDYYKRKEMKPPRAEPVHGATSLRAWLSKEYDRIMLLREKRAKLAYEAPHKALRQRCLDKVRAAVMQAYKRCNYRKSESGWAGGNHFVEILAGAPIPDAHGFTERVWSSNGKWSGTNSTHKIAVMSSWYSRVWAKGVSHVNGLLTLDATTSQAEPLREEEEALEATWVVQGRGVSLHTGDGILYRCNGGVWIHCNSVKHGRTLNRKRIKSLAEMRVAKIQKKIEAAEEIKSLADLVVTRDDCNEAGLCNPGQRDWLAKRGLDENITSLPAQKLLEMAILSNDRIECVKRAISVARKRVEIYSMAS